MAGLRLTPVTLHAQTGFETMLQNWWIVFLAVLGAVVIFFLLYQRLRGLDDKHLNELSYLASISRAVAATPPEADELAEITFLETARLLETDFFQLGVFEGNTYRTLLWVLGGNRRENLSFDLELEGEGIVGSVRRSGQPLLVSNFDEEPVPIPAEPIYPSEDRPSSGMFVPLLAEDLVIGLISVQSRRPHAFDARNLNLLTIIANCVAPAVSIIGIQSEVEKRTLQLVLIQEVSRRLISLQPLLERLTQVASLILQAFGYGSVLLYDVKDSTPSLAASATQLDFPETQELLEKSSVVERSIEDGGTLIEQLDPDQDAEGDSQISRTIMELAIPLKVEDRVLGVLNIKTEAGQGLPPEQIAILEMLAAQIGIAILEDRNFIQQQEEAWITTVLLEVARHAAQPGDAETALQAVLQLIILLAGTDWAVLLLPNEPGGALRVGPVAGLRRYFQDQAASLLISPSLLTIEPPYVEDVSTFPVPLSEDLGKLLESEDALALVLSDGEILLGVLLLENQSLSGRRLSLLAGIAHQISLRLENTRLIDEAATRRSFERELTMARNIQSSFLPKTLPTHPGWEVGATWGMAREVGGDFYDIIPLPEGSAGPRWGFVIADVADKGIPAALYMALCRTLVRTVAINRIDPGITLTRVNRLLFADTEADLFVSLFYAVWEPQTGQLTYANAGHNPPLLFMPGMRASLLTEHGMVLGVQEEENYTSFTKSIEPGQLLVLYTDGVTEATGAGSDFFGLHRLENLVLGMQDWDAQSVANLIAKRVSSFSGTTELSDDMTAVVLHSVG
jgi:serine phosphatase RsbU (regulator of sigma subunit)/putative methionine-R-sulfoxide reductase with GAF domain